MRHLLAVLSILFVVSCGGGGGSDSGGGGTPPGPPPVPPTSAEAGKLLSQATFGATLPMIADVQARGLSGWVDSQIALPGNSTAHVTYLDQRLSQLRQTNANANLGANQFYESWWKEASTAPDQLRQRVAFALSQIFVISLLDAGVDVRGAGSYYDMLNRNAFGNFRTLLEDVSLHPMMGRYLTYLANQKEDAAGTRTPDENYAREVMQLMTIGLVELNPDGTPRLDAQGAQISSYTPADIAGLAKVFTGISWYHPTPSNNTFFGRTVDPDRSIRPMIFYDTFHSTSQKSFLGVTIPASTTVDVAGDLRIALDRLFNHPNVGPFIAQRLIQQLVTSNPSPAYVQRVAAVFNNNGAGVRGDMRAVVRAILLDTEARDPAIASGASFGKVREPVIRLAHWIRAFGATSQSGNWLINSTSANTSLSQSPLASPSVFNFWRPGFTPPGSTELGSRGLVAPEMQSVDEVTVAGYLNSMQTWIDRGVGSTPPGGSGRDVQATYSAEIALADDPAVLVERMNVVLMSGQMSQVLRDRISAAVSAIAPPANNPTQAQIDAVRLNRVKTAILLAMSSSEYLVQR